MHITPRLTRFHSAYLNSHRAPTKKELAKQRKQQQLLEKQAKNRLKREKKQQQAEQMREAKRVKAEKTRLNKLAKKREREAKQLSAETTDGVYKQKKKFKER